MNKAGPRASIRYVRTEMIEGLRNGDTLSAANESRYMGTIAGTPLWIMYSCVLLLSDFHQHHPKSPTELEYQNGLRSSLDSLCKPTRA